MKYYLIHGLDRKRRIFMETQLRHSGIPKSEVTWITHPNKDDPLPDGICCDKKLTLGQIAITYKHYLALKDIVENKHTVAVVMEDNIEFLSAAPAKICEYLNQLPLDWDLLFDSDFYGWRFIEYPTRPDLLVYKKKTEETPQCHGASKGAQKLVDNFLPFSNGSDHLFNHLIRKLELNTYWADPPNVHKIQRTSTWL